MSFDLNSVLEPGMLVRHPQQPDWGLGQIQSNINGKITVNFEHMGKITIMGGAIVLERIFINNETIGPNNSA